MDCFAVSIASGILLQRFDTKVILRMATLFALFQGIMPLGGYFAGYYFKKQIEVYDHWFALVVLLFLGIKMIREGLEIENVEDDRDDAILPYVWSSLIMLAFATSIDALATGIVFISLSWVWLFIALSVIALTTFVFSIFGNYLGVRFGEMFDIRIEIWGGAMLIGIGIKIFLGHMLCS